MLNLHLPILYRLSESILPDDDAIQQIRQLCAQLQSLQERASLRDIAKSSIAQLANQCSVFSPVNTRDNTSSKSTNTKNVSMCHRCDRVYNATSCSSSILLNKDERHIPESTTEHTEQYTHSSDGIVFTNQLDKISSEDITIVTEKHLLIELNHTKHIESDEDLDGDAENAI